MDARRQRRLHSLLSKYTTSNCYSIVKAYRNAYVNVSPTALNSHSGEPTDGTFHKTEKEEEPGKSLSRVTVTFAENKYGSFLPKNVEAYPGAYAPSYLASDKIYEFWSQCRGVCKIKGKEPWHTSDDGLSQSQHQGVKDDVKKDVDIEQMIAEMIAEFQALESTCE